jgi:hypothetical protein
MELSVVADRSTKLVIACCDVSRMLLAEVIGGNRVGVLGVFSDKLYSYRPI